jgi:hypothetical protein
VAGQPARQPIVLLQELLGALSTRAATDAVQVPAGLAFPVSGRAKRHMRNARVSWW